MLGVFELKICGVDFQGSRVGVYLRLDQQRRLVKTEDIKYFLGIHLVSGRASDEETEIVIPKSQGWFFLSMLGSHQSDGVLSRLVVEMLSTMAH